jgi:hypothetical protein
VPRAQFSAPWGREKRMEKCFAKGTNMKTTSLLLSVLTMASAPLHAQPLSVAITRTPTNLNAFYLDVLNMTPGVTYGVGRKIMPDLDPFNTWTLFDVFDATAASRRYLGFGTLTQQTYAAMNLNNWTGPSVRVLSPSLLTLSHLRKSRFSLARLGRVLFWPGKAA